MNIFQLVLISIGLAMDAFAVSVSSGVTIKKMHIKHALLIGAFFGFFQGFMPYLGWTSGNFAANLIKNYDHWVAFGLLTFIGVKMIYESTFLDEDSEDNKDPLNLYILFTLAIATSIDAFAVGLSFSVLDINILKPILYIGIITFILSFIGTYIGNRLGHIFENKLEIAGGIILIGIGLKILLEHTYFC